MAFHYSPKIVTSGLCFAWDGMNPKCWDGSSTTHYDLISRGSGTKTGANALTRTGGHVYFTGGGDRVCYISFPSANITVPTGNEGTWMWAGKFIDSGNWDHPNFGKETTGTWSGTDGFVFGTGWGTDGPRWGIGGGQYTVYSSDDNNSDYIGNVWQIYTVTYQRNTVDGLKTYVTDQPYGHRLADARNANDVAIGSNSNALHIGATNSRGGNWQGNMDFVYMWNRALSSDEVLRTVWALRRKFGL